MLLAAGADPSARDMDDCKAWTIAFKREVCMPILAGAAVGKKSRTAAAERARQEIQEAADDIAIAKIEIAQMRDMFRSLLAKSEPQTSVLQ